MNDCTNSVNYLISTLYPHLQNPDQTSTDDFINESFLVNLSTYSYPRHPEIDMDFAKYLYFKGIWTNWIKESVNIKFPSSSNVDIPADSHLSKLLSFVSSIKIQKIQKGDFLFHFNDIGDKCFLVWNGWFSIWKATTIIDYPLLGEEYWEYLWKLKEMNEVHLAQEIIKWNNSTFYIRNISELTMLKEIIRKFKKKQRLEWEEIILFEKFYNISRYTSKQMLKWFVYDNFMYFRSNDFFGDFSWENEENRKRTGTVISEKETIVGVISEEVYKKYIFPSRIKYRTNEILFWHNNFFFKTISRKLFLQKVYHLFTEETFTKKGEGILHNKSPNNYWYFLREGVVQIYINSSIWGLNSIITKYVENYLKSFNLGKNEKQLLQSYHRWDKELRRLTLKSEDYRKEMTSVRKIKICIVNKGEIIGSEDFFFNFPSYITKAEITTDSVKVYKIEKSQLNYSLPEDPSEYYNLMKEKLSIYIKRLYSIKRNYIEWINKNQAFSTGKNIIKESQNQCLSSSNSKRCLSFENKSSIMNNILMTKKMEYQLQCDKERELYLWAKKSKDKLRTWKTVKQNILKSCEMWEVKNKPKMSWNKDMKNNIRKTHYKSSVNSWSHVSGLNMSNNLTLMESPSISFIHLKSEGSFNNKRQYDFIPNHKWLKNQKKYFKKNDECVDQERIKITKNMLKVFYQGLIKNSTIAK